MPVPGYIAKLSEYAENCTACAAQLRQLTGEIRGGGFSALSFEGVADAAGTPVAAILIRSERAARALADAIKDFRREVIRATARNGGPNGV